MTPCAPSARENAPDCAAIREPDASSRPRVWRRARRRAGGQSRIPKNGCELSPVDAPRRDGGDTEHGFTIEDAFIFLSVACDAGVAPACKPAEGFGTIARFSIPKIDACPAPFQAWPDHSRRRANGGQHRLRQFGSVT